MVKKEIKSKREGALPARETLILSIVLIALGTSMHFVHELPFFNKFLGNIFPVNESVWEHMKMDFYPLLLAAIYLCIRKKDIHPFGGMILAGICAIPVQIILFYCYWPLSGRPILIIDIISYIFVLALAIRTGNIWSLSPSIRKTWPLWIAAAAIVIVALAHLTWHPLDNPIFVVPE